MIPTPRIGKDAMTAVVFDPSTLEIVAACDDRTLIHYSSEGEGALEPTGEAVPAGDVYITSMSWLPSPGANSTDLIAAAGSDGTLSLMRNVTGGGGGPIERRVVVRAHSGATTCAVWNSDGSSLATCGEDGEVKVWSRNGNLRMRLAGARRGEGGHPAYDLSWGPDDAALVVASRNGLAIFRTQGQGRATRWEAQLREHGTVLSVDWNCVNDRIVCGGEDCCFRIFDSSGLLLFVSSPQGNVVSSVSWSPDGRLFAVGSFGVLCLCDERGWEHSRDEIPGAGSTLDIKWSSDGTQFVGACGGGSVVLASVVGRTAQWGSFSAQTLEPNRLCRNGVLTDLTNSIS